MMGIYIKPPVIPGLSIHQHRDPRNWITVRQCIPTALGCLKGWRFRHQSGTEQAIPARRRTQLLAPTGEGLSSATLAGAPPHMGNRNIISARQYLGSPSYQQQSGSEFGTPYALKLECDTSKISAATPSRTPTAPRLQASPLEPSARTLVPPRRIS
jgi:hypothetical protein